MGKEKNLRRKSANRHENIVLRDSSNPWEARCPKTGISTCDFTQAHDRSGLKDLIPRTGFKNLLVYCVRMHTHHFPHGEVRGKLLGARSHLPSCFWGLCGGVNPRTAQLLALAPHLSHLASCVGVLNCTSGFLLGFWDATPVVMLG